MNISVWGVIEIQTAITKDCGSEIYCVCSSSIRKGTQKIWRKHSRDITMRNRIGPLKVE